MAPPSPLPGPRPHARRLPRAVLFLTALVGGAFLTFVWPRENGLDLDFDTSARAQVARTLEPYDLTQLQVLNRAILEVKDHYVDPTRVQPRRMLLAGLSAIQRSVAPLLVDYAEGAPSATIRVGTASRTFDVAGVDSPWALASRFRDVFAFIQEKLHDEDIKLRDVEYAAVNGMLSTLDPHSVLLTPDVYEEMRMSTRGEFGGLGIVISIREGQLTILRPMPNTPASRAGLARRDRIVQIDDESTLNMPLSEAVDRLRGAPGSNVTVHIVREGQGGWERPRPFQLTRAIIHIDSVESRMLGDGIGYIKLESFQGNTYADMRTALAQLHAQGLRGLVLDLRDNPGGLLDQAVQIADAFLESGTIVTTSSNDPAQREEKTARADDTEPNYPIAVLINGGSASASEIVAGALKNHDRAVIIGERSFGKGSVQVLYDFQDGSALKLTIAQYLTPGDVSIQEVGIVPDIAIDPMTVDAEDMDLEVDQTYLRERDLRSHLTHGAARAGEEARTVLRYYLSPDVRQRLREAEPEDAAENEREDEFLLRFSRLLLSQTPARSREPILDSARPVLERAAQEEMARAVAELRRLGVDWSVGADAGASAVDVQVSTNRPDNTATAGEPFELRVRVTNRGAAPLYQLRATTKSDHRLFDGRELVFGRVLPGQSREWSTTLGYCETEGNARRCALPPSLPDRADGVRISFMEAHGHAPPPAELRTVVRALPMPAFAYAVQVADNVRGNGDGVAQRGEHLTLYVRAKNVGAGPTLETQANLRNLSGHGILLRRGRFELSPMAPGDERDVAFTFEVLPDFEGTEAKLEVALTDTELREGVTERIVIPVATGGAPALAARTGTGNLRVGAVVLDRPAESGGRPLGTIEGGTMRVPLGAASSSMVRVDLGGGRPGWVAAADLVATASGAGRIRWDLNHMPPHLEVDLGSTLVTRSEHLRIRGRAYDERPVRDMYVFVGARKVLYRTPSDGAREATFDANVPLQPGVNYVTVVARETHDVLSRRTFVVRRDGPDGALLDSPRHVDDPDLWEPAAEED